MKNVTVCLFFSDDIENKILYFFIKITFIKYYIKDKSCKIDKNLINIVFNTQLIFICINC
jgi:hypothetical protein